jgi:hypothetical protein
MKPGTLGLVGCNLAVAGLQLLFFLPVVDGGRTLDVALWAGRPPLFRVDRLSLLFGVAWAVALALATLAAQANGKRWAWMWLVTLGLLGAAYAREPVLFYVGWEVAGVGVWLSAPPSAWATRARSRVKMAALVHGPGLALLAAIALGRVGAFVPPEGGAAQVWTLAATLLMGLAAGGRALAPALYAWMGLGAHQETPQDRWLMLAVFASTGPFLLAKALVEARWDEWGVWALTLAGTAMLLGVAAAAWRGTNSLLPLYLAAMALIGLGLAPASPMAAMGAILLVGLGAFLPLVSLLDGNEPYLRWARAATVAASVPGVWLVVQGAVEARYIVTAVVILPALMLAAYVGANRLRGGAGVSKAVLFAALLALAAIAAYPQAAVEWFARPAVGAMAGGVGASSRLVSEWGLGLVSTGPSESLTAALPATGVALAAFLAWVALYWLRGLLTAITNRAEKRLPPGSQ